jgi:hypothetical protein
MLSDDRLLDITFEILQINLELLKNGTLEGDADHEAYFKRHVALLRGLLREAWIEGGGLKLL